MFAAAVWMRLRSYEAAAETTDGGVTITEAAGEPVATPATDNASEILVITEGSSATTDVAAATAREQRYRELLRTPPPPTAQPRQEDVAAQAKPRDPSLFDRIVAPIASVIGGGRSKPAVQPPPAPPSTQRTAAQRASDHAAERAAREEELRRKQEQDPDTDITPPQLLAAEFIPPQVHDGEETIFSAIVNDNLSGVRSVSGVIASPSGSLQGFACQREAETNRFVAKITVPRDAPEGIWQVRYLTLTDQASNSVSLNQAQGALPPTASFRVVSSASDAKGPALKRVWLDKPAMLAGDRNTIFVEADDDRSGVSLVSGVFASPSKSARIGFGCRLGGTGIWECPLAPPACLDCGIWQLEQIQLQDKANNMATFRADDPAVRGVVVDIAADRCDSAPPVISSIILDPPVVSNAEGGQIRVQAIVTDDGCGVASVSGQAIPRGGIGGQRASFSMRPAADGGQMFVGTIAIQKHAAKGTWTIAWLQTLDKGHNLRAYSANDPVVARATFIVE